MFRTLMHASRRPIAIALGAIGATAFSRHVHAVAQNRTDDLVPYVGSDEVPYVRKRLDYVEGITPVYCFPSGKIIFKCPTSDLSLAEEHIFRAACLGDGYVIKKLSAEGVNVNTQDKFGLTPLHVAVSNGELRAIEALMEADANVNAQDLDGRTPVFTAAACGKEEAITILKSAGANVDTPNRDGYTPLHAAINNRKWGAITDLLNSGANPNIRTKWGRTALEQAEHIGDVEAAHRLTQHFKRYPNGVKPVLVHARIEIPIAASPASFEQRSAVVLTQFQAHPPAVPVEKTQNNLCRPVGRF